MNEKEIRKIRCKSIMTGEMEPLNLTPDLKQLIDEFFKDQDRRGCNFYLMKGARLVLSRKLLTRRTISTRMLDMTQSKK